MWIFARRRDTGRSTQHHFVITDTTYPHFEEQFDALEDSHQEEILRTVEKIERMTWVDVQKTSSKGANKRGINWELTGHKTKQGKSIAAIRISGAHRARVMRDQQFMVFISIHTDHDSTYKALGGDDIPLRG